jgi:UDP-2-acetamido-2-deoxy-ribo-hexuluronate aminotransferase
MKFIDLAAQQERIKDKIDRNIQNVLSHGKYIMGPEVQELEQRLAEFVSVKHCIGCSSGTDALLMALMAKGVGPGDIIFTSPFTFIATAEPLSLLGATPVFVDIDLQTFNIDPAKLELAIQAVKDNDDSNHPLPSVLRSPSPGDSRTSELQPRVFGIITVDLFGLPCDYGSINAVASEHDLFVIEDAAQALGGEYKGKKACALAEIGCTSFFPAKPLGCYGDGGAVFTDSDEIVEKLISIRVHGKGNHKYDNARIGLNGRLDTIQAAILNAKLDIFPEEIDLRQKVAQRYTDLFSPQTSNEEGIMLPQTPRDSRSVWAQYSVLASSHEARTKMQAELKAAGIPTAIYYPRPLHLQTVFAYLGYKKGDFEVSENASSRIFSLPMHPYLKEEEQRKIAKILNNQRDPQITRINTD